MPRFELQVEGEDLGAAQLALNEAGIPTIARGAPGQIERRKGGGLVRRFFRSAAFPILMVIVVAFFAQKLISPDPRDREVSYDDFLSQVELAPETIESVTLDPDDTAVEVREKDGDEFETGYPPSAEADLVKDLRRQGIETEVESTGGGSLAGLIAYLLPFLLFFAFWWFVMRRMERRGESLINVGGRSQPQSLSAVIEAGSADEAERRVEGALPPGGGHRVRSG